MNWTTTRPTKPGKYKYRTTICPLLVSTCDIVRANRRLLFLSHVTHLYWWLDEIDEEQFEWAGPIEEPE